MSKTEGLTASPPIQPESTSGIPFGINAAASAAANSAASFSCFFNAILAAFSFAFFSSFRFLLSALAAANSAGVGALGSIGVCEVATGCGVGAVTVEVEGAEEKGAGDPAEELAAAKAAAAREEEPRRILVLGAEDEGVLDGPAIDDGGGG